MGKTVEEEVKSLAARKGKYKKKLLCCRACLVTSQDTWQRGCMFLFGLEMSKKGTSNTNSSDTSIPFKKHFWCCWNSAQKSQAKPFSIHVQIYIILEFISRYYTSFFVKYPDIISIFNLRNQGMCLLICSLRNWQANRSSHQMYSLKQLVCQKSVTKAGSGSLNIRD